MANSPDTDQTAEQEPYDLELHCFSCIILALCKISRDFSNYLALFCS